MTNEPDNLIIPIRPKSRLEIDISQLDKDILLEVSRADKLAALPDDDREAFLNKLTDEQRRNLAYDWSFWARPKQIAPVGDWRYWLLLAGRGYGKSRIGAETINIEVMKAQKKGKKLIIGLVGATYKAIENIMVKGRSGILNIGDPAFRPIWKKGRLYWKNGSVAHAITAEKPDAIRGHEFDLLWIDELGSFRYGEEVMNQLKLANGRINPPKAIITTTPKPLKILREFVDNAQARKCYVTNGSSYENTLLSEEYKEELAQYKGTRLELQEIYGFILDDIKGALWSRDIIPKLDLLEYRDTYHKEWNKGVDFKLEDFLKDMETVVIGVDPATTANLRSDETGIIVAAKDKKGRGWIIADLSGKYEVMEWANIVNAAYYKYGAKLIIAERNQGGDMVENSMKQVNTSLKIKTVHAQDGKIARAEPISLLYDQGKIIHLGKKFLLLEDQMCNFTGNAVKRDMNPESEHKVVSPDRMDAMVYALTELFIEGKKPPARGMMDFNF